MSPSLFCRLASDADFRAAVREAPERALASLQLPPWQQRLLQLTACRLESGLLPPISAYWWDVKPDDDPWVPQNAHV